MKLGKVQTLIVSEKTKFGAYLKDAQQDLHQKGKVLKVLLPKKELTPDIGIGDELEVFLYTDSEDRLVATRKKPAMQVGEIGPLKVKEITPIGIFGDIGLDKDILIPHREIAGAPRAGDEVLVYLYEDKSGRLAAGMYVYKHLQIADIYKKGDEVKGRVYEVKDFGTLIAVDNKYFGMIPASELYESYKIGDEVCAYVSRVREDGKLDLSTRRQAYLQIEGDAKLLYEILQKEGSLKLTEKASPDEIKKEYGLSKGAFKRAVGNLLKNGKLRIKNDGRICKNLPPERGGR